MPQYFQFALGYSPAPPSRPTGAWIGLGIPRRLPARAGRRGGNVRPGRAHGVGRRRAPEFNYDYSVAFHQDQLEGGASVYNYGGQSWRLPDAPGVSVFAKGDHGSVFHTYSAHARGIDTLNNAFQYLDLVPKGRNEEGLTFSLAWVRYNDEYASAVPAAGWNGCPPCDRYRGVRRGPRTLAAGRNASQRWRR